MPLNTRRHPVQHRLAPAQIEAEAHRLRAWIEASAREAAANPAKAAKLGIKPQQPMSLFADAAGGIMTTRADWLRGAVAALLPRGWRWRIAEDTAGCATLFLVGFDDSAPS